MDSSNETAEKEAYLSCLEVCLEGLPAESRELIVDYYRDDKRDRIDRRKELADRLGLRREVLANRYEWPDLSLISEIEHRQFTDENE